MLIKTLITTLALTTSSMALAASDTAGTVMPPAPQGPYVSTDNPSAFDRSPVPGRLMPGARMNAFPPAGFDPMIHHRAATAPKAAQPRPNAKGQTSANAPAPASGFGGRPFGKPFNAPHNGRPYGAMQHPGSAPQPPKRPDWANKQERPDWAATQNRHKQDAEKRRLEWTAEQKSRREAIEKKRQEWEAERKRRQEAAVKKRQTWDAEQKRRYQDIEKKRQEWIAAQKRPGRAQAAQRPTPPAWVQRPQGPARMWTPQRPAWADPRYFQGRPPVGMSGH